MRVYADNAATTKLSPAAKEAMLPYFDEIYGNPSTLYTLGQEAAEHLLACRTEIAQLIGAADPREIVFTSGGSEADNQAIISAARNGARKGKKHLISTKFEHHAVLHTLDKLRKEGFDVTLLDVHENGVVRVEDVAAAIRDDTALVSVMFANNEIGTIQPIEAIGALCRERGIPFHTDAVQAVGHVPVDVQAMHIDLLSCSAHKFHGPRGVGFLYARRGIPLTNIIEGGAQERGKRGGTENTPAIAGMAAALREAVDHMAENTEKVTRLRETLIAGLSTIEHARLNGDRDRRVPGTVNFCFEGIEGESLLLLLDRRASPLRPAAPAPPARSTPAMCCWPSACRTRWRTGRCVCPWANITRTRKWRTSWTMSGRWSPTCAASPRCGTSWRPARART